MMMMMMIITNRKSHMGFWLVPTSVNLSDIIALILPNLIAVEVDYISVVEDWPKMSAEYCLLLLAKTDPLCSTVSLR